MKKYISILSLVAALALQSCDRSDLLSNPEEQISNRGEKSKERSTVLDERPSDEDHSLMNKPDTGDDDEPRKDKSHWRTANDTIRP